MVNIFHFQCREFMMHQTKKASVKPTFSSMGTQETVKFQQDYKRALKAQNKTFNQNGKFAKVFAWLWSSCICMQRKTLIWTEKMQFCSTSSWTYLKENGPQSMDQQRTKRKRQPLVLVLALLTFLCAEEKTSESSVKTMRLRSVCSKTRAA